MKKLIIIAILFLSSYASYAQQQIPGSDFENWTQNYFNPLFPSMFYWELEPNNIWDSPNEGVSIAGDFPTERTTDAQSGSYAARLETKSVFSVPATGTIFLGYLIPDMLNTRAMLGIPFTEKPSSFNGFFKYSPAYYSSGGVQTIDSCAIIALLSYWDGSQRVTIAEANYYTSDTIANYTPFSIPFVYSLPNTPDTISIIFSSSVNGNFFIGGIGSTLFIDNISFDYSSSIEKPSEKIALKKRYLDENLLLDFEEAFSGKIRLLNTNAQEIYVNETEEAHSFSIPLSALPKGIYILEINSFTGKRYTDKIIRL